MTDITIPPAAPPSHLWRSRKVTADITIPPEAVEAAAEDLFHMQYDDSKGSWSDAPEWLKVTIRKEARAACLAMLNNWPGMTERFSPNDPTRPPGVFLPLTEKPSK